MTGTADPLVPSTEVGRDYLALYPGSDNTWLRDTILAIEAAAEQRGRQSASAPPSVARDPLERLAEFHDWTPTNPHPYLPNDPDNGLCRLGDPVAREDHYIPDSMHFSCLGCGAAGVQGPTYCARHGDWLCWNCVNAIRNPGAQRDRLRAALAELLDTAVETDVTATDEYGNPCVVQAMTNAAMDRARALLKEIGS